MDHRLDSTRFGVITACTIGTCVSLTPAVHATFGLFLVPLSQAFGWKRASISAVLGIVAVSCAVGYPVAGRYADRHGARRIILAGSVGLAVAIGLLALTSGNLLQFYLDFLLIGIAGALPSSALFSKVVSDWFDRDRGLMLGISAGGGNGVGSTLVPILAAAVLSTHGWRWAYVAVALAVLLVGVPVLLWGLRDPPRYAATGAPAPAPAGLTLTEAVRTPAFWLIVVAIASGGGCLTAVFSHVVPLLGERHYGIAAGTAVLGVFALVCAAWQIATGAILDRAASPQVVAPMFLFAVGGLAVLELAQGQRALLAAGAMLGIGLGSQYGAMPVFVARYFGLRAFGSIIGVMYSAVILAQGLTPILLDHAFDVQGTYRNAVAVIGTCLAAAAGLLLLLPPFRTAQAVPKGVPGHV